MSKIESIKDIENLNISNYKKQGIIYIIEKALSNSGTPLLINVHEDCVDTVEESYNYIAYKSGDGTLDIYLGGAKNKRWDYHGVSDNIVTKGFIKRVVGYLNWSQEKLLA